MGRTAPGAGSFGADPDGTDSDDSDCSAGNAEGRVCTICQNRKPLHEFYVGRNRAARTVAASSAKPLSTLEPTSASRIAGPTHFALQKDATKPLGHDRLCKVCKKARADARKQAAPVAIVQRQCSICKEVKASNDFIRDARRSTGLDARCKVCRRQQHQKRKLANIAAGGPSVLEKECKRCQQVKPATAFKRHAYTTTGLDSWCKDCCKQRRSEKSEQLRQDRCPPASPRPFLPPSSPSATTSTTPPPPSLLTPLPNTAAGHAAGSSSEGGAMGSAAAMAAETVSWGLAAAAKPAVASQATGRQAATQAEEPLAAMAGYPADPACILKAPGAAGELGPVLPARPGQGLGIQGLGQGICGAQVGGWDANQGLGQGLGLSTAQAIVPMVGVCAASRMHLPPASCLVLPAPCPAPAAAPGPAQMAPGSTCLPDARCWTAAWPPLPQGQDAWQQQQQERHTGWAVVTHGPGGQVIAHRGDRQQATQVLQTERQRKGWPGLAPGAQGDNKTAVMPQAPASATTTDADVPRTQRTLTFAGWEAAMSAQPSTPSHDRSLATSDAIWSQAGAGRGGCTGSRPGVDMTLDMSFSLNLNLNAVTPRLGSPADATPAFPAPSKPLWPAESAQLIQACLQTWLQQPSGVEGSSLTPSLNLPLPPPPPQDAATAPVESRAPPALQIHPLATGCPAAAEGGQPGTNESPAMATPLALGTPSWLVEGSMNLAAGRAHQASTHHSGNPLPLAGHLGLPPAHPSPTSAPTHSPPSPAPSPQPQLASLTTLLDPPGPTPLAGGTNPPAAPLAPGPASVEAAGAVPDPCEASAGLPDLAPPPSSCPSLPWGSSLLGGEPHQLLCSGSVGALFGQQSAVLQPLGGLGAGLDKGSLGGVGVGGAGPGKEQGQGREVERVGGGAQEASGGAGLERRGLEGGLPEQQQQQQAQQQGRQQQVRTHTSMSVFATAQRLMLSTDPPAADPAQGSGPDPSGNSGPAAAGQLPSSAWQALFSSFAAGAPTAAPPATPAVAGARGGGGEAGGLPAPLLSGSQSQALGHKVSGSSCWLLHSSAFDSLMGTRLASGLLPGSLVLDSLAGMAGAGSPAAAAAAGQAGQAPPLRPHSLSPISSLAAAAPLPVM